MDGRHTTEKAEMRTRPQVSVRCPGEHPPRTDAWVMLTEDAQDAGAFSGRCRVCGREFGVLLRVVEAGTDD